ncbi:hypothetical protein J6590_010904 [Homalodisca vitripennis]|nr:hypothetical protein J6590_010904 [Homalodisca vitripennis]
MYAVMALSGNGPIHSLILISQLTQRKWVTPGSEARRRSMWRWLRMRMTPLPFKVLVAQSPPPPPMPAP